MMQLSYEKQANFQNRLRMRTHYQCEQKESVHDDIGNNASEEYCTFTTAPNCNKIANTFLSSIMTALSLCDFYSGSIGTPCAHLTDLIAWYGTRHEFPDLSNENHLDEIDTLCRQHVMSLAFYDVRLSKECISNMPVIVFPRTDRIPEMHMCHISVACFTYNSHRYIELITTKTSTSKRLSLTLRQKIRFVKYGNKKFIGRSSNRWHQVSDLEYRIQLQEKMAVL